MDFRKRGQLAGWIKLSLALVLVFAPYHDLASQSSPGANRSREGTSANRNRPGSSSSSTRSGSSTPQRRATPAPARSSSSSGQQRPRSSTAQPRSTPSPQSTPQPTPAVPITRETLPGAIAQAIRPFPAVGVHIESAFGGGPIFVHNASRPYIPASNRKIYTGAFVLDQLGPDYRFLTTLHRTGPLRGGVVQGDLVLTPSGDPTKNSVLFPGQSNDWVYRDWANRLRSLGVTRVSGGLVIDCSAWDLRDLTPRGWAPRIKSDHYAPRTGPLNVNSNLITVRVNPGSPGGAPTVDFQPPAPGYPVVVQATTGEGPGFRVAYGANGRITVTGRGTRATQVRLPVDDPKLYAAAVLRGHMRSAGITIDQGIRIATRRGELPAPTRETILAAYQSPPMADMVRHMMKRSDNHFAEQLYVAVSHVKLGRGGYSESKKLEEEFLRRVRVPTAGVRKEDGSGLSELNTVTAESTVRLLQAMLNHPHGRAFVDSLAVSGRDGTLRSRMRDNAATDRVRAKTGFIQGVSCLSGYLVPEGQSAEPIAFSLLFNRLQGGPGVARATQDRICEMMVNALK